ncbi:hypothetical protein Tco_1102333 [Tanacetum coccineum]
MLWRLKLCNPILLQRNRCIMREEDPEISNTKRLSERQVYVSASGALKRGFREVVGSLLLVFTTRLRLIMRGPVFRGQMLYMHEWAVDANNEHLPSSALSYYLEIRRNQYSLTLLAFH